MICELRPWNLNRDGQGWVYRSNLLFTEGEFASLGKMLAMDILFRVMGRLHNAAWLRIILND